MMIELIKSLRIVPVVAISDASKAEDLANALVAAGLPIAEITLRTPASLEALKIAANNKDLHVGVGSLRNGEDLKKAIDAGVYSIMAAHNELNGIPCHMNKWLMTDILRDEFGFNGFYVSDWLDIERINTLHHTANDMKEASYLSVDAGMDMHMHGPKFTEAIIASVEEGKLSINRVNDACRKILTAKFKLGLFENRFVDLEKKGELLFTDEHKATALESARKGIVLLKNNGTLPLQKTTSKKKIFVTGPNANNQSILGDWHAVQPDENVTTVYEGIKTLGETKGYAVNFFNSGENIRNIKVSKIKEALLKFRIKAITPLVAKNKAVRNPKDNKLPF